MSLLVLGLVVLVLVLGGILASALLLVVWVLVLALAGHGRGLGVREGHVVCVGGVVDLLDVRCLRGAGKHGLGLCRRRVPPIRDSGEEGCRADSAMPSLGLLEVRLRALLPVTRADTSRSSSSSSEASAAHGAGSCAEPLGRDHLANAEREHVREGARNAGEG
jgi:hypothetical protein